MLFRDPCISAFKNLISLHDHGLRGLRGFKMCGCELSVWLGIVCDGEFGDWEAKLLGLGLIAQTGASGAVLLPGTSTMPLLACFQWTLRKAWSWWTTGAKAAPCRATRAAETELLQWPPQRKPRKATMQPVLAWSTMKTFVSETNSTEGIRHLNIVAPELLIAMLGKEQLRRLWARLGPRDGNGNGNSCHGDRKERPTKGITNMHESEGAWGWIMQGDAAVVPTLFLSPGSTATLSTYHLVCFVTAGGQPLCYRHLYLQKFKKEKKSSSKGSKTLNKLNSSPCLCWKKDCWWRYGSAFSSPRVTKNSLNMREGEKENQ